MRILLSLGWLLGVSGVLCAKTVALWPIDWDLEICWTFSMTTKRTICDAQPIRPMIWRP